MNGQLMSLEIADVRTAIRHLQNGAGRMTNSAIYINELPSQYPYFVVGGVDACVDFILRFDVSRVDVACLLEVGFSASTVEALRQISFTGDVWCVPDGRIVFEEEPILEIRAPLVEVLLLRNTVLRLISEYSAPAGTRLHFIDDLAFGGHVVREQGRLPQPREVFFTSSRLLEPYVIEGQRARVSDGVNDARRWLQHDLRWWRGHSTADSKGS